MHGDMIQVDGVRDWPWLRRSSTAARCTSTWAPQPDSSGTVPFNTLAVATLLPLKGTVPLLPR